MNRWLPGLLAACSAASLSFAAGEGGSATPATLAERELLALERQWAAAENKGDAATLRTILDDRFVATFSSGKTVGKEEFISTVAGGAVDPTQTQELTDETILVDGDTAVIVGTDTVRGTDQGKAYTQSLRITTTYIRRDGRWWALAEQFATLRPVAATAPH